MKRYVSVDAGKFATKVDEYLFEENKIKSFAFRTCVSDGDFRDDAIEKNTIIMSSGNNVYKVGNGARGNGAELTTSKMTNIHKLCIYAALAKIASDNEVDEFFIATSLPATEWANVSKREDFKEFMFPADEVTISVKKDSESEVVEKKFKIVKAFVYPESIGAIFMDDSPELEDGECVGVIDIGNLNINACLWQISQGSAELIQDHSTTTELGGSILRQQIVTEINSKFSGRFTEADAAMLLKLNRNDRMLKEKYVGSKEEQKRSKTIIKNAIDKYVSTVKRCCDGLEWSTNMTIVAIGGTTAVIQEELLEAFPNIVFIENSMYCNAHALLRMLCARMPEINKVIPLK